MWYIASKDYHDASLRPKQITQLNLLQIYGHNAQIKDLYCRSIRNTLDNTVSD